MIDEMFSSYQYIEARNEYRQSIQFNHQGKIFFIQVQWASMSNNRVKYRNIVLQADFRLMPDYCIITKSKSGFMHSSSHQEICYIDRGLTEQDITDVYKMCLLPFMTQANNIPLLEEAEIAQLEQAQE